MIEIDLDTLEELVVSAPARAIEDRSDGDLVLTNQRLLFVVGGAIRFAAPRAEITLAFQRDPQQLWVGRRGAQMNIGFQLRSCFAGSVRWDWYLMPPMARGRSDPMPARADDERLGVVDEKRRSVLELWQEMMSVGTLSPISHYLDGLSEDEPVEWADIVEIVYIVEGEGDGPAWMLVARLDDDRWVYFQHAVEITGDAYTTTVVARSLESLWWGALVEEDRERVTAQMTGERLGEELVKLDALLQSDEPFVRARAEFRIAQINAQRGL